MGSGNPQYCYFYALFLQFADFPGRSIAPDTAFRSLMIVNFTSFFRKCVSDIFSIGDNTIDNLFQSAIGASALFLSIFNFHIVCPAPDGIDARHIRSMQSFGDLMNAANGTTR